MLSRQGFCLFGRYCSCIPCDKSLLIGFCVHRALWYKSDVVVCSLSFLHQNGGWKLLGSCDLRPHQWCWQGILLILVLGWRVGSILVIWRDVWGYRIWQNTGTISRFNALSIGPCLRFILNIWFTRVIFLIIELPIPAICRAVSATFVPYRRDSRYLDFYRMTYV